MERAARVRANAQLSFFSWPIREGEGSATSRSGNPLDQGNDGDASGMRHDAIDRRDAHSSTLDGAGD